MRTIPNAYGEIKPFQPESSDLLTEDDIKTPMVIQGYYTRKFVRVMSKYNHLYILSKESDRMDSYELEVPDTTTSIYDLQKFWTHIHPNELKTEEKKPVKQEVVNPYHSNGKYWNQGD